MEEDTVKVGRVFQKYRWFAGACLNPNGDENTLHCRGFSNAFSLVEESPRKGLVGCQGRFR